MLNTYSKLVAMLTLLFTLASCASLPTDININPELDLEKNAYTFKQSDTWQIASQDLRVARHLIEIIDGDNVAQLINEQQSLRLLVEKSLTQAWINNKLKVNKSSEHQANIKLIKALATVTESTLSYDVDSQMVIKIELNYQGKNFVKLFRSNKQWDAAFSTSAAGITEQLNVQISQLLNQIIQDPELNSKLQQF
ncbi:YajG family lipoprotein [Vibrio sp. 1-Bac 57]|uniref:YajG family lipoprotein n=1 Tax=uncultured Psychromonas sp. TaxID=173974 RepID=UPI002626659A|nr:YajG family lipoprotein [uncultured Psychromonas sp.]